MAAKRIILLLDGTWNDADLGASDTHIIRMREIIAHSLDVRSTVIPPGTNALTASSDQKVVAGRTFQNLEHLVFYERGVGTGPLLSTVSRAALSVMASPAISAEPINFFHIITKRAIRFSFLDFREAHTQQGL